ncbi:hypothetical protein T08_4244 [Trichinella sp. T8]|nr:hypothetical protein T08_4244 [Trichinella sp. T8]
MNTANGILLRAFCNNRLTASWAICSFLVFHFNEYGCVYLAEDTIKSMTISWIISRLYVCHSSSPACHFSELTEFYIYIERYEATGLRKNHRLTAALGNYSFLVRHFNEYGFGYLAEDTIKSMTTSWTISRLYVCFIPHHQHAILQMPIRMNLRQSLIIMLGGWVKEGDILSNSIYLSHHANSSSCHFPLFP